ncbi:helix-turn-helix transcriptional regulator [Pelagicoccus sp. SDUM812003]|uniref:AraC family transcriptional regulator n=1 Tax=Pelagicoccus sp. SDUM812003 TaxID=3041267 RepID=UPI00280E1C53|nr:helix-turn-helix transcriptional regulator [Pelagicoccus sp. SDUM812003]MDQ8205250.1 helix-turn-helix transcriptional regulator [Pelagicoccus sp. SDUM812003]
MKEQVFARVDGGAEEVRHDTRYYWDNSRRSESNRINLQRTLSGEAFWEDENGRQSVPVGKIMLFTQRENSRYGFPATGSQPYRHRYLSIDPTATAIPIFNRIRQDFGSVLSMPAQSESSALFDQVFHCFSQRSFRDRYHESELITRLLTAIYRQQVEETQDSDPIEYGYYLLQNQHTSPITLKDVAARCGVSREHFIRSFHERYQEPPGKILRSLRLKHAQSILEATRLPIKDVALASGFSSSNVFCRAFRSAFGMSPADYRKQLAT